MLYCFFVDLVRAGLITVKRIVNLLSDFKLQEQEARTFLLWFEDLHADSEMQDSVTLKIIPLVIPIFGRMEEVYKIFKRLLEDKLVSVAIAEQFLSFAIEFVEQKIVDFSSGSLFSFYFAYLIRNNLIDIDTLLNRLFNYDSDEVQEFGLLCLQDFTQEDFISPKIIDRYLPFVIKTTVHPQSKIGSAALKVLQSFIDHHLISQTIVEPHLPSIIEMIMDSDHQVQKVGLLCLSMLIASKSITDLHSKKIWDLLISKLKNSEFAHFEEVLLVLKNYILYELISAECAAVQQVSCCIARMQSTNRLLENTTLDFLEASIAQGLINDKNVEM